jgi:hypothetical protein
METCEVQDNIRTKRRQRDFSHSKTAHILDVMVRRDKRSYRFLKSLIRYGKSKFDVDKLVWERSKYPDRELKEMGV